MIKQSDLALAAWKATERTLDAVVTINKIDYKTTDIASISYDAGGYTGDTFGIGSNYENSVTIKFSHLIEGLKPGMTVWPKIGIKTSNGYEYSSLGLFIVSDDIQMDRNNDETTIKAYDQMCLLEGTYTSKLTYPAKMTSVIAEIANLAGVLLNTTDISRLPVQVNLPSAITGQTYRNAIGMIAQFYAGFATFDRDGKLTIRTITEPDYTLDPSQYEQGGLTKNEAPYKIGGIQCEVTTTTTDSTGQSTETTNTLQVGATSGSQIKLTNNLMTMDRLASIWQQLQSLTFYPFSLNWFGNPAIEAGDWLTLQDTKSNKFNVPNNGYTMTFDGSLSAVSKADQTSTSSSSYAWRGELSQYVADLGGRQGASGNYIYGTDTTEPPYGAKFNDIWYKQNGNKVELWTYERQVDGTGKWVLTVSDATGEEVKAKVDQVELEAKASTDAAKAASDKADQLAAKYDDTNALANQALDRAIDAQSDASIAVATANSTASGFGRVDQKADNAVASALNAQSAASDAVKQASSAAADSKDAKQIAGAVSQNYKTLTDGSTMTIAELQNGLAAKLTKSDLNGYATQTWTQNQIKMTADGINGTMSSIKSTVDGQTTSINDLKADSSSFKSQFTTVNNTLGKQTTDIGSLQASSKELTTGFNTLTSDNTTNKNDISQLKQTATEVSSTLETVKTQVQDSAVGTNLVTNSKFSGNSLADWVVDPGITTSFDSSGNLVLDVKAASANRIYYSGSQLLVAGMTYAISFYAYVDSSSTNSSIVMKAGPYDNLTSIPVSGTTLTRYTGIIKPVWGGSGTLTIAIGAFNSGTVGDIVHITRIKLEKGSLATDWSANPADNATVTAVSNLSQTVDGMKADISKKIEQKDLNGYATQTWTQNQIKTTADGINGTISSVKSTVDGHTTSINALQADSSGFKARFQTVNDTIGKHTTDIGTLQASTKSLSASFDSLSSDNNTNKHNISQLQASATAFNSTLLTVQQQVTDSAVGINLLRNTKDYSDWSKWSGEGNVDPTIVRDYAFTDLIQITGLTNSGKFSASMAGGGPVYLVTGQSYTFSVYAKAYTKSGAGLGINLGLYGDYTSQMQAGGGLSITKFINGDWTRYSVTFVAKGSGPFGGWRVLASSVTPVDDLISIYFWGLKLEKGTVATNYSNNPADDASAVAVSSISQTVDAIQTTVRGKVDNDTYQSKMTQLNDLIDLRVEKDGVVNAINETPERIKISGNKLLITADTYIDNAVIKDSMIESLDAGKITAGTINAANINVINLNANNITTGTINGSNLSINLNTGNVEFQEGRIHNSSNTIDININEGYMSVANGSNRVMLKNGEMQFVQPGLYDTSSDPYLRISNTFGGQSTEGAAFIGRKYAVLTNSEDATGNGMFDVGLGTERFSGFATGYGTGLLNKGWHATKVGGANRGVIISGGKEATYRKYATASPSITVGASGSTAGSSRGPNIVMDCNYLYSFSTWVQTSSHAANVYVADDGAIVRASSASKYKTNIERSFDTGMGERILEIPTAHWFDKAEVRKKTLDPQAPDPRRYFGMIADDLDDAGLTELVEYNDKGEVEGLMYDRIALTIIPIVRNYRDRITKLESEIKQLKEG
ncbi:phage head spike fiber domain-containing protein [Lactiplantibacillus pentosus]|uniref:phage head spike fiber domain-containing protein n=1 Tax=Lactiplantibacillus pentosus TaxID=1589 RepID=UPI003C232974